MKSFLKSVERQAYRMAMVASSNREDALGLVQGAMCRFVDRYGTRPAPEWKPLFYRILHNGIRDFHRRQSIRRRWRIWLHGPAEKPGEDREDPLEQTADPTGTTPEDQTTQTEAGEALQQALRELPLRQQQAFLLRYRRRSMAEHEPRTAEDRQGAAAALEVPAARASSGHP